MTMTPVSSKAKLSVYRCGIGKISLRA